MSCFGSRDCASVIIVFLLGHRSHSHVVVDCRYLEQADWVLEDAMQSAWEDSEWKEEDVKAQKTGGDICIKVNMKNGVPVGFRAQGAGDTVPYGKFDNGRMESVASGVDMTIYEEVPTSVSKNMSSNDLYKVRFVLQ